MWWRFASLKVCPSEKMLTIINGDDLGASAPVNQAILRHLEAGRITSASILSNGPAFLEAVAATARIRSCPVGVHLNFTEFPPLTSSPTLRRLLDANGALHRVLRYRCFGPCEMAAVYAEFAAQIRRAMQCGIRVTHIDSHHHIHTRPDFLPLVKALQCKFSIRNVRARLNLYPLHEPPRPGVRLAIPLYNAALRWPPGARSTDCMCRLSVFVEHLASGWRPRLRSVELMVHPGASEPSYVSEMNLLESDWQRMLPRPYRLGSFADL